jgi:hypothetical protein
MRILGEYCQSCHGAAVKLSNLDLRTRESMLQGGERGPALVPGDPEKSRIYLYTAHLEQPAMPPGAKLSKEKVDALKQWIADGAPMPKPDEVSANKEDEAAKAALARMEERPITPEERKFWVFQRPKQTAVPTGAANPVDAFLNAKLKEKGLKAASKADKRTLVRRAYLDLHGLPPKPEEVDAFLKDERPDAFGRLVDRLLELPHYGERWGRHWLDVVRYADSGGFEYDRERPNAWRYRDYVVQAFNSDKPYDQFLKEQLAGDELLPNSKEARIATGYLRLGLENNLKNEQTRLDELDDLVGVTSNAMLGMTVQCARCHNHKFDPIPQKDYYQLQAVFFPTKAVEHPLVSPEEVAAFEAAQKEIAAKQKPLKDALAELEKPYRDRIYQAKIAKLPSYVRTALETPEEKRTEGQKLNAAQVKNTLKVEDFELVASLNDADCRKRQAILDQMEALDKQKPQPLPTAMSISEPGKDAPPSYFLHRGSPGAKGSLMKPGVLTVATEGEWSAPEAPAEASTSYRRLALANWIASKDNPLTARVMVNRIWQHHFGEGLVRSTNNFGKTGDRPTHPELLDWLAVEFMNRGWSIKAMHRMLMNSEAYQRSSDDSKAEAEKDPENRYLWRMPRRRLEAEAIRDAVLAVAGNLDRTVGGPAVFPYIDPALFQSSSKRTWNGKPDTDPSTWRRSVYVFQKRSIPLPMLEVFDKPDSVSSCARRNRSTIAPQALILMNNAFVRMEAEKFAERLKADAGSSAEAQVKRAFELALSRPPSHAELERSIAFVQAGSGGLVDFCHALFNLNEFVYVP